MTPSEALTENRDRLDWIKWALHHSGDPLLIEEQLDLYLAIEQEAQREAQGIPLIDVDGIVAELVGVEAALEDVRRRLIRATNTLGGVARLSEPSPVEEPEQPEAVK